MGSTQYPFNNNGSMIFLDLSYNQLVGGIPRELGRMYYLMILNLGHNMLSGPIPSDLESLHYVGVLDLPHNVLKGSISSSFSGLSMMSEINLSNNKLNRTIPELGQLATFPWYRYENNFGLCGLPLPSCDERANGTSSSQHQGSRSGRGSLAGSMAMGLLFHPSYSEDGKAAEVEQQFGRKSSQGRGGGKGRLPDQSKKVEGWAFSWSKRSWSRFSWLRHPLPKLS